MDKIIWESLILKLIYRSQISHSSNMVIYRIRHGNSIVFAPTLSSQKIPGSLCVHSQILEKIPFEICYLCIQILHICHFLSFLKENAIQSHFLYSITKTFLKLHSSIYFLSSIFFQPNSSLSLYISNSSLLFQNILPECIFKGIFSMVAWQFFLYLILSPTLSTYFFLCWFQLFIFKIFDLFLNVLF